MAARFQDLRKLVSDIRESLAAAGYPMDESRTALPKVPTKIAESFDLAASSKSCTGVEGFRAYLDAIVYHLQSYRGSPQILAPIIQPRAAPTVPQYISLLKCLWLLRRMQRHRFLDRFCPDALSKAYVDQLERTVTAEFRRYEGKGAWTKPGLDDMLLEHEQKLEIWPDLGIIDTMPAITEPQAFESELFKVPLQRLVNHRDQNMSVFRSGENNLRLAIVVTSRKVAGAENFNHELDCRKVILIPLYAHPENCSSCSFTWRSSADMDVASGKELPFNNADDLLQFQQAVTNFGVRSDPVGLTAIYGKQSLRDGKYGTELGQRGHAQLWLYCKPPAPNRPSEEQSEPVDNSSSTKSSSARSWSLEYIKKRNANSTLRSNKSGSFLDPPVPAQLVVFTSLGKHLHLVSITVDHNTIIDHDLCDCGSK